VKVLAVGVNADVRRNDTSLTWTKKLSVLCGQLNLAHVTKNKIYIYIYIYKEETKTNECRVRSGLNLRSTNAVQNNVTKYTVENQEDYGANERSLRCHFK